MLFTVDVVMQKLWETEGAGPEILFSKWNKTYFGYFDPEIFFLDSENEHFSGWPNEYFG